MVSPHTLLNARARRPELQVFFLCFELDRVRVAEVTATQERKGRRTKADSSHRFWQWLGLEIQSDADADVISVES